MRYFLHVAIAAIVMLMMILAATISFAQIRPYGVGPNPVVPEQFQGRGPLSPLPVNPRLNQGPIPGVPEHRPPASLKALKASPVPEDTPSIGQPSPAGTAADFVQAKQGGFDFTQPLVGLNGKPISAVVTEGAPPISTMGDFVANALTMMFRDEAPGGADKVARWKLAMKIKDAKGVDLTADEIKMIKDVVAKAYSPLIVGQVWSVLDPASVK